MSGRWVKKYSDEQRDLIDTLRNVHNVPRRDVVRICAEGYDGVEPFEIPLSSLDLIARKARAQRASETLSPHTPPDQALAELIRSGLELLAYQAQRFQAQRDRGKNLDMSAVRGFFQATKAWQELSARAPLARKFDACAEDPDAPLRRLMEDAKREGN